MDGAIEAIVSGIGGGKKGEDTRNKTTLTADKLFSFWAPSVPLMLLAFIMYFDSSTYQSSGIACEPETYQNAETFEKYISGNQNRFYYHQYCWEKAKHTVTAYNNITESMEPTGEIIDISVHKNFPYVALFLIAITCLPTVIWSKIAEKGLQTEVELLLDNLIEAINMTVAEVVVNLKLSKEFYENRAKIADDEDAIGGGLLSDSKVQYSVFSTVFSSYRNVGSPAHMTSSAKYATSSLGQEPDTILMNEAGLKNESEKPLIDNTNHLEIHDELEKSLKENRYEQIQAKFKSFQKFLHDNSSSKEYFYKFVTYRIFSMLVLCAVNYILYTYSYMVDMSLFNCEINYTNPNFTEKERITEIIHCNITGVGSRKIISAAWIVANFFIILAVFIQTAIDIYSIGNSQYLLEMIDQVIDTDTYMAMSKYNDLSLLLKLVSLNLADKNKVFSMALKSWNIAAGLYKFDNTNGEYLADKMNNICLGHKKRSKFLAILSSTVAIKMEEDIDKAVNEIADAGLAD